jgi:hypothetical protein
MCPHSPDAKEPHVLRRATLLLLVLMAMASTGCVAPRALGLYALAKDTAPLLPGERLVKTTVRPVLTYGNGPSLQVLINSSGPAGELLSFYRKHLLRRGWVEDESSQNLAAPDPSRGAEWYRFTRVRSLGSGTHAWTYATEKLQLVLDVSDHPQRPKGSVKVEFAIDGDYAWDIPSKLPAWAIGALLGEGAQLFGWINLPL